MGREHDGLSPGKRGSTFVEVGDRKQNAEAAAAVTWTVIFSFNKVSGIWAVILCAHIAYTLNKSQTCIISGLLFSP